MLRNLLLLIATFLGLGFQTLSADALEGRQFYFRGISGTATLHSTVLDTVIDTTINLADADQTDLGGALYFTEDLAITIEDGDTTSVAPYSWDPINETVSLIDTSEESLSDTMVFKVVETSLGVNLTIDSMEVVDSSLQIIFKDLVYILEEFVGAPISPFEGSTTSRNENLPFLLTQNLPQGNLLSLYNSEGRVVYQANIEDPLRFLESLSLNPGHYLFKLETRAVIKTGSFFFHP